MHPPLSAPFITMEASFVKLFIVFLSLRVISKDAFFCVTCLGIILVMSMYSSKLWFLPLGDSKKLIFLTKESSWSILLLQ